MNIQTFVKKSVGVAGFEPAASCSQSRRDDRATLHPEKGVKYNQFLKRIEKKLAESVGFEPTRQLPVDSLANCSINHSGNSPILRTSLPLNGGCKCKLSILILQQKVLKNIIN